jgi:hypothetical protein
VARRLLEHTNRRLGARQAGRHVGLGGGIARVNPRVGETTERVRTYERTAHAEGLSFSPTRCVLPTPLLEEDNREREGAVDIAELIGPSRGGT